MTRFRVFVLLFAMTLTGALMYGRAMWWSIAGALFALITLSIIWSWLGVNWIRVGRRTVTRVGQVGQTLEEEFRVTNLSRFPKLWTEIKDESDLPGHYASRVLGYIGPKQWYGWRSATRCLERGRFRLGPIVVRSGDPLGIYSMQRPIQIVNSLLVYPATVEFHSFPLPMGYLPGGDAQRRRTHYITTNAAGVRDYVNGDSFNRIHWGLSARRQRLVVKEFELDPMSDLWIAIDLHPSAQIVGNTDQTLEELLDAHLLPPDTLEYMVSIAASAARFFLRQDRSVGLIAYGAHREVLPSDQGERQANKLMEMFAVMKAESPLPFGRVLDAELPHVPRGATVVAISASPNMDWAVAIQRAARSGLRVVAIVLDASSFNPDLSSAELISTLAETGAVVRVVRCGDPLAEAIERGLV